MPYLDPHFRPPPRPATADPREPAGPTPLEEMQTLLQRPRALSADPGFDDGEEPVGRVEPQPRFRALAAGGGHASVAAQPGGAGGVRNPFLDQVSLTKSDMNPDRVAAMMGLK